MVIVEIPRNKGESEGGASLQMAMGYIASLSNQYDVLDSKAALLMGANFVLLSMSASAFVLVKMSTYFLIAPAIIVILGTLVGMYVLRPRSVIQFIDPTTLVKNYRYGNYANDEIAWALVESVQDSANSYETIIRSKGFGVQFIQISFGLMIISVVSSVLYEVLA